MRIKTFYSKSMSEALREIKTTLGPEALLLSTKEVPRRSGVWSRSSGFEVVAAIDQSEDVDVFSPSGSLRAEDEKTLVSEPEFMEMPSHGIETEVYSPAAMKRKQTAASPLREKKRTAVSSAKNGKTNKAIVDAAKKTEEMAAEKEFPLTGRVPVALYQELMRCGVEPSLARKLVLNAWDSSAAGQRRNRPALLRLIEQATHDLIAAPSTQDGMPGKKIVAFVGPTGVGKTTSIAKLAARLALQMNQRVILVTLDGYRIGAIEQLRCYASLMGIPFRFADQVTELHTIIKENAQRDYILIDTAGRGPGDMDAMSGLATFLKESDSIERHLVLSATTKPSDLRQIMDRFEICCPDYLLFTKLDETSTPGPILNELVRTQKRFSYYTDGQRVPDDLHAVSGDRIIDIVLNRNENTFKE
jgi:flagellar biosynthesis protein FlhF